MLKIPSDIILFHGAILDERGDACVDAWGPECNKISVSYDIEKMSICVGNSSIDADSVTKLLSEYSHTKIVLEATTLGFAELFILVSGLFELGIHQINIVYVEPASYARTHLGADHFALSDAMQGYQPIPRSVIDLGSDDLEAGVFFLGFEPERLDRAFEEHQMISNSEIKVVFGVPAFHPGWELDSIIPHLPRLLQTTAQIEYCSANDPEAAFECLERTRSSLGVGKRMFVSPIGPKPCGIAAALFASKYGDQVGLLFDHPVRRAKRTDGALIWHRYRIKISK